MTVAAIYTEGSGSFVFRTMDTGGILIFTGTGFQYCFAGYRAVPAGVTSFYQSREYILMQTFAVRYVDDADAAPVFHRTVAAVRGRIGADTRAVFVLHIPFGHSAARPWGLPLFELLSSEFVDGGFIHNRNFHRPARDDSL